MTEKRTWENVATMLLDRIDTHPAHLTCLTCKTIHLVQSRHLVIKCAQCRTATGYDKRALFYLWSRATWLFATSQHTAHYNPYVEVLRFAVLACTPNFIDVATLWRADRPVALQDVLWSHPVDLNRWRRR